jgi:periplasmic copper chaperone A
MKGVTRSLTAGIAVAGAIAFTAGTAWAQNYHVGQIDVDNPWALATTGFDLTNGAAYMRLSDHGTQPDQLVSASSPVARKIELHVFNVENGIYGMHPVSAIQVSPGTAPTVLEPGGAHVMLEGLTQPLKAGDRFPLTLTFEKAGKLRVEVRVEGSEPMTARATN